MGYDGPDARAARAIPAVFLQPPLHLLESHPRSRHSHLLQRPDAADTSADQLLEGVHAATGEQRTDVPAAAISHEHRYEETTAN